AQGAPDSAVTEAGAHYAARGPLAGLTVAVFGAHHRDLWAEPVKAEVLALHGARGYRVLGAASLVLLEPALALEDNRGVRWRFTPLDPQFGEVMTALADNPGAGLVLQDLVSARHPGAPLVASALACQAGVAHPEPALRFLPDAPDLGPSRERFGGQLGWLTPAPRGADSVRLTAQALLQALEANPALPVDTLDYLRARLFDILVGDADPAPERAPWARGGDGRWRPAPRLRWDAFARYGGVVAFLARPVMPEATTFGPEYPGRLGQNPAQFILDARLLAPLPESAWDSVAGSLAAALDNDVIAEAVAALPPEWNPDGGAELATALRARRDHLREAARSLFERLRDDPPEGSDLRAATLRQALASEDPQHLNGTFFAPWYNFQVQSDIGLFVSGGPSWTTWAPGYAPWQRRARARLGYATGAQAFRLEAQLEQHWQNSALWLRLDGLASGVEVLRFYGYGNETPTDSADTDFYRAHQTHYVAGAWLGTQAGERGEFAAGPVVQHVTTRDGSNLVNEVRPYGSEDFSALGVRGAFRWDSRDAPAAASRGVLLDVGGSWYGGWLDAEAPYGELHLLASTYLSPGDWLTFAPRLGARHAWGRFPLHEAAFIGGHERVRGLEPNRYAGEAAAWVNTDTRVRTGTVPFLVDWDFGVVGIADLGRVWLGGESSDRWHLGAGGGFWMMLPERGLAATLTAVASEGRLGFAVDLRFDY
ncbi:MAG TPA: BamA/TamA family outer membrane protein, partial [Gemmatimonadales bacterium]|nr:BamA/TamA family outer membrane protein [Gemmatimonadales bacterium]